jgi:CheY-like chemotaxis protein
MIRLEQWDEVKRLLDVLRAENWSMEQQAELSRAVGSSLWLRLRVADAGLTAEQQQLLSTVLGAPAKLARDPAKIDQWIEQLGKADEGARRLAQLRLQDGGLIAVQRLVDHLLSGTQGVAPAQLAATLVEFGSDGEDALRAACLVKSKERAARVYLALAQVQSKNFSVELGAGVAGSHLPQKSQEQLVELLDARYAQLPEPSAVRDFINQKFDEATVRYQQKRVSDSKFGTYVWRPTPDGQNIQLSEVPATERQLERLAQLAVHRMSLINASRTDEVDCAVVLLQRAYQLSPTLGAEEVATHLLAPLDEAATQDAGYWQAVVERANAWQMHGAALRALQLMGEHAVQGDIPPPLNFLSQLLRDPRPMMRYTALQTITKLDPAEKYAGSEHALETAMEMVGLAAGPQALVIGLQAELRQTAGYQLQQQTGAEAVMVNSAKAALQALSGNQPIELIVIADRVSDLSLFELLQRLRNTRGGQSLPIAVLTDRLYQHERRQIETMPGVFMSVLTNDEQQMERVIAKMHETLDTRPLTDADRGEFAVTAGRFLAKIAADRERYAFYPLSDWRQQLVSLQRGLTATGRMDVMSAVGSVDGQVALAEMAANAKLAEAERVAAAMAFGKSVKRFGMLMPSSEIQQTYDLYNQLGPNDPAAAKALGLILDIAEAQAGKTDWPEGL